MTEFLKQIFGDAVTEDVLSQFKAELGKKFVAKSDYNTKRDELISARSKIEELTAQTEKLQLRANDADTLASQLAEIQEKYDRHVAVLNGEIEQVKLEGEISSLIRRKGGKNEKAVRALLSLGDENPMESAEQQLDLLIKSDPYLFDVSSPAGGKGNFPRSAISPAEGLTYSQMMQLEANKI